ncbi:LOW QUALITY PROTEIN: HUWE1-associated protein modifying stress responses 2 [Molossus nigricans]
MDEPLKEDEAEVAEHWFSKWESQCLDLAQEEQLTQELQDEKDEETRRTEVAGPKCEQQKLWHLFQVSTTSMAQLYKGSGCPQSELSMWDAFQNVAMAVTSLYKESRNAHQQSFDLYVQVGYQSCIKDVLDWVKNDRSTILQEDLISFLCGKVPPTPLPCTPKMATESYSSVINLQPFHEAIALHGLSGTMASISMKSVTPSSPPQTGGVWNSVTSHGQQKSNILEDDLNSSDLEDLALCLATSATKWCN